MARKEKESVFEGIEETEPALAEPVLHPTARKALDALCAHLHLDEAQVVEGFLLIAEEESRRGFGWVPLGNRIRAMRRRTGLPA